MNTNGENNRFQYTYSASEQAEIKRIRERYTEKGREEEDKMARLRRLDARVKPWFLASSELLYSDSE